VTESLLDVEADCCAGQQGSLPAVMKRGDGKHFSGNLWVRECEERVWGEGVGEWKCD